MFKLLQTENLSLTTEGVSKKKENNKHEKNIKMSRSSLTEFDFTDQIKCFYLHENSIYIGADATVWPCCMFYDSYRKKHTTFMDTISGYPENFNNLNYHKIEQIFDNVFFKTITSRWKKSKDNPLFSKECVKFCSQKGAMAPQDEKERLI